jgi:uncharacterized iron-regulated protein
MEHVVMDPDTLTTALLAALAAGADSAAGDVAKKAVVDGYDGLKALLKRKFGNDNSVSKAVDALESDPDSQGLKMVVGEKIKASKATDDPDVLAAAQALLDQIKTQPGGADIIITVQGNYNAVVHGSGRATVIHRSGQTDKA